MKPAHVMKPLYLRSRYTQEIRSRRATHDEIRERITTPDLPDELVRVAIDDDGDMIATPLAAAERATMRAELDADRLATFLSILDDALKLYRRAECADGIRCGDVVKIWGDSAPWCIEPLAAWASENGLHVVDEPRPTAPTRAWIRVLHVYLNGDYHYHSDAIVRVQWNAIDVNPENDVVAEIACVAIAKGFNEESF